MKRASAIIGPTPSFVRWAIRQACPFRQIVSDDLPYQTFLQLRGLREISIGYLDQRIVNGICIQAELNQDTESARGFPVNEIFKLYGDENGIETTCGSCPANVARCLEQDSSEFGRAEHSGRGVWAGCYGWLPARTESDDFPKSFEQSVTDSESELLSGFAHASTAWFRIWQTSIWDASQLAKLDRILQMVNSKLNTESVCSDFANLRLAVEACLKNELVLETELIPKGNSDGIHWRIEPHCSRCRNEMRMDCRKCDQCGHRGHPRESIKRKVLGLRPYMLLKNILGIRETANLLAAFREMKQT